MCLPKSLAAALAVALALAFAAALPASAEEQRVNVYNWNDYVASSTIGDFEEATGIRVRYDLYDSNATLQGKLLTGHTGYDVVYPSIEYAGRQIKAGIFQPLDKAQLPNLKHLDPIVLESIAAADPGNKHVVPYMWYTTGVAINVEKVSAALGGRLPDDAWQLLFDPAVTAKLQGCGISMMDEASDVLPAAMLYSGQDAARIDRDGIRAALNRILPVRKHVRTFNTAPIDQMAKGSLCVAMMFSGDALIAARRARESNTGAEVRYLIPKSGAMMSVDVMAIPRDAPHPRHAHTWINAMLEPATVAKISNETFYISANRDAVPLMSKALVDDPVINVPDDVKRTLRAKPVLASAVQRELTRALARFKAAR